MKKSVVIFAYFVLILSTLLVFGQVRKFSFVNYDDNSYVYENPQVLKGLTWDGITWAFTTNRTGYWHPLTWLSLMLDCQLFGADASWMHLVNLLLHIANTLLLFAVLKKMTGALWPSAFVAAAFAIHPMHVESVAWIAERKDVLSTLFLLLTLAAYVSYVRHRGIVRYVLTVLLFALGLLAKPMLVTLPVLLLLLDYWPFNRFTAELAETADKKHKFNSVNSAIRPAGRLLIEKVPFFVLSVVSSMITFLASRSSGAVTGINALSLSCRIANVFLSYARYIGKMFWPQNLAVFYPFDIGRFTLWQVAMCVLLFFVISIFVIRFRQKQRYLLVGWFWFIGTLIPVIGLVQSGAQSHADRYTYISYTGLFIIIAWGLSELLSKWPQRKIALGLSMVIVLSTLAVCTYRQASYWKNTSTLFSHALDATQNNYIAHNYIGITYNNLGRYQDAIENYKQAIKIEPDYVEAYFNLGIAHNNIGRYQDAIENYKQAIKIRQDYAKAYINLGIAYNNLGRYQDAIEAYKQAITINPDYAEAHINLGVAYHSLGRQENAIEAYKQAMKIKPDYAEAYLNLGIVYYELGRYQDAIEAYKRAIRIKPDITAIHYVLGVAYLANGDKNSALEEYNFLKTIDAGKANELLKLINK